MATKIYVRGLNSKTTESELEELFSGYGDVDSTSIAKYPSNGKSKGFAYIEMSSSEQAQKAITSIRGKEFNGRKLTVSQVMNRG